MKLNAAQAALKYVADNQVVGVGSGSTVKYFIEQLATMKDRIAGAVASSVATEQLLQGFKIPILDFNSIDELPIYIDGADAYNSVKELVKGGGGALTREKILAYASKKFICMVDASKQPSILGKFPIAIEVIPMARSSVARKLVALGGQPRYREHFVTDNGNIILDTYGWEITHPIELEEKINQIPGVIANGIFAVRAADEIIIGDQHGASIL